MARRPTRTPKVPAPQSQIRPTVDTALAGDPRFADFVSQVAQYRVSLGDGNSREATASEKREKLRGLMNARFDKQIGSTEAVDNLIWTGGVIEGAIEAGIIPRGGIEMYVRDETKFELGYVRLGRSFFRDRDLIPLALQFYHENDVPEVRARTGWKFKVAQPTGVVLVRDAMKAKRVYDEAMREGKTELEALKEIDAQYPTTPPPQPAEALTANKRRFILEAVCIHALCYLARSNRDAPILKYWPNPQVFIAWSNSHPYSQEEDKAQIAARNAPSLPWNEVDDRYLLDFNPRPPREEAEGEGRDGPQPPSPDEDTIMEDVMRSYDDAMDQPEPETEDEIFRFREVLPDETLPDGAATRVNPATGANEVEEVRTAQGAWEPWVVFAGTAETNRTILEGVATGRNTALRQARDAGWARAEVEVVQIAGRQWVWRVRAEVREAISQAIQETASEPPTTENNSSEPEQWHR